MTARVDVPETSLHKVKRDPQEELIGGTQCFRANALSGCVHNRMSQKRHAFQGLFDPAFSAFVFLAPKCVCFKLFFGHG